MPVASAPPLTDIVVTAWRDALTAWRRLPLQSAIACAILFAEIFVKSVAGLDSETLQFSDLAFSTATALLLLPYELMLYRSYILGESQRGYSFEFNPRFRRFLLWSAIVWLPLAMLYVVGMSGTDDEGNIGVAAVTLFVLFGAMLFVALVFTALLFPAIAVDAPGASLGNAIADSRGHVLRVIAVIVAAILPVVPLMVIGLAVSSALGVEDFNQSTMSRVIDALFGVASTTIFVVGMARLYELLAVRLKCEAAV